MKTLMNAKIDSALAILILATLMAESIRYLWFDGDVEGIAMCALLMLVRVFVWVVVQEDANDAQE